MLSMEYPEVAGMADHADDPNAMGTLLEVGGMQQQQQQEQQEQQNDNDHGILFAPAQW